MLDKKHTGIIYIPEYVNLRTPFTTISRTSTTLWNGLVWKMPDGLWTKKRPMTRGSRDFCRFSKQYRKTRRLS